MMATILSVGKFSDKYKRLPERLGEGTYGDVFLCRALKTRPRRLYAVKTMEKSAPACTEAALLRSVSNSCPYIVKLIDAYYDQRAHAHLLVLERAHYTLRQKLAQHAQMPESTVAVIARQLGAGLAFLHARGYAHRDVKPTNILCFQQGERFSVKLSDFGNATRMRPDKRLGIAGTVRYIAPEVAAMALPHYSRPAKRLAYGCNCDVWSLGVITYELLLRKTPFPFHCKDRRRVCEHCQQLVDDERLFEHAPEELQRRLSVTARDFLRSTIRCDPEARLQADAIAAHAWIKEYDYIPTPTLPMRQLERDAEDFGASSNWLADLISCILCSRT